ncbi:MAG TPA: hypothetical protein PK509_07725, partial [Catalimonadaceae bacterium]|nr:hypothetical protein [Catalimonadaceae bacterium]
MKVLPTKLYLPAALLMHIVAAWFSLGWQHPDEHYQLIEFARYLLGEFPADLLPWEFGAGMRPTFQVFLAAAFMKVTSFIGVADPFDVVFLLRASQEFRPLSPSITGINNLPSVIWLNRTFTFLFHYGPGDL